MCGPVMESAIKTLLKIETSPVLCNSVEKCIKYLQSIDDELFEYIYLNMPSDMGVYRSNATEILAANQDVEDEDDIEYNYYEYAYAYLSNIDLIKKCLSISMVPLNYILLVLTSPEVSALSYKYVNFCTESCKLLLYKCNMGSLLAVACHKGDYNSMVYIVNNMSPYDIYDLLYTGAYELLNLTIILVIDRIYNLKDKCLITLLNDKLSSINSSINLSSIDLYYNSIDLLSMHLRCYTIIKYMSLDDAKLMMTKINGFYLAQTKPGSDPGIIQLLHNKLLEFHFRPRGAHTKGAI
jgi:hypothetical protein